MKTTQVIIQPNGREGREVNKMKMPIRSNMGGLKWINRMLKWQQQEKKLRTFTIDPDQLFEQCGDQFTPGTVHSAKIINEEKLIVRIV